MSSEAREHPENLVPLELKNRLCDLICLINRYPGGPEYLEFICANALEVIEEQVGHVHQPLN